MKLKEFKVDEIKPYKKNAKKHPMKQLLQIAMSIKEFGWQQPIVVDKEGTIIVGHGRYFAYNKFKEEIDLGEPDIKTTDLSEQKAKAYRIADNKLNQSDWDEELLIEELKSLEEDMLKLTGFDESYIKSVETKDDIKAGLKEEFIIPPFSIWDTRQGYWKTRKRKWQKYYGDSRDGRDDSLLGEGLKKLSQNAGMNLNGTSEFDPVLTEVCFRWFNTENGRILDPFAGGVVRGAVAGVLDNEYHGIDLSKKQIEVNKKIIKDLQLDVNYYYGNSKNLDKIVEGEFDLIFSCPPYYDLEKYEDGDGDLSMAETYESFIEDYNIIIDKAVKRLKNNRFAIFTVGNIRDKSGFYRDFVTDTIKAFESAGAKFYNDIILINAVAAAGMRARRPFNSNRKVTKVHQNILVFYKGDIKNTKKSYEDLPQIHQYHENVLVFYKGDLEEIKENYKVVKPDLFLETEDDEQI